MISDWKIYLKYYLMTAHGMITTLLGLFLLEMIFTGSETGFIVFLAAWLIRDSREESPAILVLSESAEAESE